MRIWEVSFSVYEPFRSFPRPGELVVEKQFLPSYRLEGKWRRKQSGGQLSCTLSGEGRFHVGKREYRITPGKAFLHLHADARTGYGYPPDATEPWIFIWISIHGLAGEAIIRELNQRYGFIFELPLDRGIIKNLFAWRAYRNTVQAMSSPAAASLAMDILTGIAETREQEHHENVQSNLVRRAQQYILEHLDQALTTAELAGALQVSREHLSRIFADHLGAGPAEYIRKRKIRLACHLLRESSLSGQELASRVGYENPNSFARAFKSITGITPKIFRQTAYSNKPD